MVWMNQELFCKRKKEFEFNMLEVLWLELKLFNVKVLLGVCYGPPNANAEWWFNFEEMLNLVKDNYSGHIVLAGDFNSDPKTQNYKKNYSVSVPYLIWKYILMSQPILMEVYSINLLQTVPFLLIVTMTISPLGFG